MKMKNVKRIIYKFHDLNIPLFLIVYNTDCKGKSDRSGPKNL